MKPVDSRNIPQTTPSRTRGSLGNVTIAHELAHPLAKNIASLGSQEIPKKSLSERKVTVASEPPFPRATRGLPPTPSSTAAQKTNKKPASLHKPPTRKKDSLLSTIEKIKNPDLRKALFNLLEEHKDNPKARESIECILTINRFSTEKTLRYFEALLKSSSTENIEVFHGKISNELDKVLSSKLDQRLEKIQSERTDDLFMTQNDCLATDSSKILSSIIVDRNGDIDKSAIASILRMRENNKGNTTKTNSFVHNAHVTKMLERLQGDLADSLSDVKAPTNQDSDIARFIRQAVGKNMNDPITNVDAKRAIVICLLDELYQEDISGSCYTTSLAMNIRSQYPKLFIDDMKNIIDHGYYTRIIDGKPHLFFPMKKALDNKLESGVVRIREQKQALDGTKSPTIKKDINEQTLHSLVTAFNGMQNADGSNLSVSIEEIQEAIAPHLKTKFVFRDKNGVETKIIPSEQKLYAAKARKGEGDIVKTQELSLKETIKLVLLKKVGLSPEELAKVKKEGLTDNQTPEAQKYREYLKLKNWVQQSFSNNQVTRLLRGWEYSLGTSTLDTIQNPTLTSRTDIVSSRIMSLLSSDPAFIEQFSKIPENCFTLFFDNLCEQLDSRIGVEYNKGVLVFFDKSNLSDYDEKKTIASSEELRKLIGLIIIKAGQKTLRDKEIKWKDQTQKNNVKNTIISLAKYVSNKKEQIDTTTKPSIKGGSASRSLANYCGKSDLDTPTVSITPTSPKDLAVQLINLVQTSIQSQDISQKSLNDGTVTMPVEARDHAFALVPSQGLFKDAINSKQSAEKWLQTLAIGKTIVIANLNYTHNGKHVYLGVQKTGNDQYNFVELLDTESLHSDPEILPESIVSPDDFLWQPWTVVTTFNKDAEALERELVH